MKGGDRGCPRGPDNEPHLLPHTYELPARFIVPAGACRPGLRPFRPSAAREGGAGRRGHPVPTVHVRKEKHKEVLPRGAGCSPASRTRCWWLAPRGPRWTDLPPCSGAHILSTAGGNLSPARPYSGYGKRHTRRPCDARQVRRAPRGLGRSGTGALRPRSGTTRSRPARGNACTRPSGGPGRRPP